MAETEETPDTAGTKRSRRPLVVGFVLAVLLGGGGFLGVWSGAVPLPGDRPSAATAARLPDIHFVALEPLLINLGPATSGRHLRFNAQLEVERAYQGEVAFLMPRILDVLNGYLRAVDLADLEDPSALIRLRAQMLRRIQVVTGEGRVRDLLVTEFVLN